MITIGFSTRYDNPNFISYLQKTCMYANVEIIQKINNGEKSLSKVYNEILEESSHDIVVLCHDDIEFETKNWGGKILDHFRRNSDFGILGLAGSKFLHENAKWWTIPQTMYGIVNHQNDGKKWTSTYSKDLGKQIEEVVLVDGLFLALNKKQLRHKFDEEIFGFHFYDLGLCVPNYLDNVNIGVIFDVRVTHLSIGQTNDQWEENRKVFSEKYKEHLPLEIKKEGLNETFIFVHDQDYIIDFEEKNKFKNLEKYTYVFLGHGSIDKLQNINNIIISRDLPENIEDFPMLTAFTGWYSLWKNGFIKTKYVNLFEYDILLDPNFQQYLDRFYYENADMVGFVPLYMKNFHFIRNEKWVEHIIPSIKKHYNVDVVDLYEKVLQQNPNAIWSTTSNVSMKKDVFDSYMKWFLPILTDIKETNTSGHAFERSITFFSTIKRKRVLIAPNILKHIQMDSHKTQGHFVNKEIINL